jgi:UDP-N-acetylglucosamine 2-epimerase (non-hydrolysing)
VNAQPAQVMLVLGTRPEAIKMCPLVHALRATPKLRPTVVSTGQHTTMLDEVLQLFDVVPDVNLALHRPGQSLADLTARSIGGISDALSAYRPDAVVVQGDTATTFAGALSAYYQRIPVVHLEAGLRSDDRNEPFPEEVHRRMVTTLADLHLAATQHNRARLLAEGVPAHDIAVVGNTVIDALLRAVRWTNPWTTKDLETLDTDARALVLITVHRRESWGQPLQALAQALAAFAADRPDLRFVWPMHANPAVQQAIRPAFRAARNVVLTGPLNYADFTRVLTSATIVLTDSGGIQEEAPALGKPVLVLRNVTERREAVETGSATLVGTDPNRIRSEAEKALANPIRPARSPYGDGSAATRAAAAIESLLGVGNRLPDFKGAPCRGPAFPAAS